MGFKSFHLDAGGLFYSLLTKTLDKFDAVKYNMVLQQSFFPYEYTPLYENGKFEHKSSQRRLLKALPKKTLFCPIRPIFPFLHFYTKKHEKEYFDQPLECHWSKYTTGDI